MAILTVKSIVEIYNIDYSEIRAIAKKYGCRVIFHSSHKAPAATVMCRKSIIELNLFHLEDDKVRLLSALFHELGHVHCFRNNIWNHYHRITDFGITKKSVNKFIRTAYRAESWVDKWGQNEMKKYFPRFKFIHGYKPGDKERMKFLRDYYQKWLNEVIK